MKNVQSKKQYYRISHVLITLGFSVEAQSIVLLYANVKLLLEWLREMTCVYKNTKH